MDVLEAHEVDNFDEINEDVVSELVDSFEGRVETRLLCHECINYINCIEEYKNSKGELICENCGEIRPAALKVFEDHHISVPGVPVPK